MKTNQLTMEKNENKGRVIPLQEEEGIWMSPENARHYIKDGISLGTMMNNLRAGRYRRFARKNEYGWWVRIPQYVIESKRMRVIMRDDAKVIPLYSDQQPLKVA